MLMLIDTRDHRPDPSERPQREPLLLDIPELRPWRWYVATVVCMVVSGYVAAWLSMLLVVGGLCCFFQALTSYYKGNDGLSKFRQ
jgi:hypothetical protein